MAVVTVWHTGCPMSRREGLRVLGTRREAGWGLGITEIGRTGISSPHNIKRQVFQANPQQKTKDVLRHVMLDLTQRYCSVLMEAAPCLVQGRVEDYLHGEQGAGFAPTIVVRTGTSQPATSRHDVCPREITSSRV